MKKWTGLSLAVVAASLAGMLLVKGDDRSVQVIPLPAYEIPGKFDREQSAALFVGVRSFPTDGTIDLVPYAVDDAVDLAYAFALERNSALVKPQRVVLALSGRAVKKASRERLRKLVAAGAQVSDASEADIRRLLEQQAGLAKRDGVFIVAVASHGFSREGTPYVLAATSIVEEPETWISSAKISDIAATSEARRSLIFVDACRERVASRRGVQRQLREPSGAALKHAYGQAIFYAGTYAYDDYRNENGVFTHAILENLRCRYAKTGRGPITVEALADDILKRVPAWIEANRDPTGTSGGIQIVIDGNMKSMVLATCPPACAPARITHEEANLTAYDCNDALIWTRGVFGSIVRSDVADLDGDDLNEVIVAEESGAVVAFDAAGEQLWRTDAGKGVIEKLLVCELFRKNERQIVKISSENSRWRLSVFNTDGTALGFYEHPGRLQQVIVDRVTSRHARKILVIAKDERTANGHDVVFALNPKKIAKGPIWYRVAPRAIERLEIVDYDHDRRSEIAVITSAGPTYLGFDGQFLSGAVPFRKANAAQ